MSYYDFILEIVEGLTEERIGNFYREQNIDDAYTFEEFLPELEDFLNDNYGDILFGEPNHKHLTFLRKHPEEREDIWAGVCQDLEEYYEKEEPHKCEWSDDCEKPAVYCKEFGLEYCSEHICESLGGSWCDYNTCGSCNKARAADAIEAAKMEAQYGPALVN